MKVNSRIYLKGLLILFILLTTVLLFPPYTINNNAYKFFGFILDSEYVFKKLDKTYSYKINPLKRNITEMDTIDAINVLTINMADTNYNYIQIKELPKPKITPKKSSDDLTQISQRIWRRIKLQKNPEYYKKEIDTIINYTITEVEKPHYLKGYRKLLINQLIIEILLSVSVSGIVFVVLLLRNANKVGNIPKT